MSRPHSETERMRQRTAHGDITATTVVYAVLAGLIIAGRWGWIGLTCYALVAGPAVGYWCARRMEERRRMYG